MTEVNSKSIAQECKYFFGIGTTLLLLSWIPIGIMAAIVIPYHFRFNDYPGDIAIFGLLLGFFIFTVPAIILNSYVPPDLQYKDVLAMFLGLLLTIWIPITILSVVCPFHLISACPLNLMTASALSVFGLYFLVLAALLRKFGCCSRFAVKGH